MAIPEAVNTTPPRRLLLVSYPRTASNLFMRILSPADQPNVVCEKSGGYFFLPTRILIKELGISEKPYDQWNDDEQSALKNCFQECFDKLQAHVELAGTEGKTVVAKEHASFLMDPTALDSGIEGKPEAPWRVQLPDTYDGVPPTNLAPNMTVLPDEFLMTWFPTFLIRHPALSVPSFYRTCIVDDDGKPVDLESFPMTLELHTRLRWTRMIYDWYSEQWNRSNGDSNGSTNGPKPIILDADDILTKPEVMIRFCRLVGLDSSKLRFNWEPAGKQELKEEIVGAKKMKATLLSSSGIVAGKTADSLCLDQKAAEWKNEFGEVEGSKIEKLVKAAMPDYEYLQSKRLTA